MTHIPPELVERMVDLVRDLHADHLKYDLHDRQQDFCQRTAAIVADLPEPVDPDWIEAGKIATKGAFTVCRWNPATMRDLGHRYPHHTIYDAIKRGRELERGL